MKILFVCLGNICRSPLAEGIMKHKIEAAGLSQKIAVDSCGTANYHIGDKPDERTRNNAMKNGVRLTHLGRQISATDLAEFDFVLAMDRSNHQNIMRLATASQHAAKVKLIREFDSEPGDEVPDPYYGGEQGFQEVYEILDRSVDGFIDYLKSQNLI